MQFWQLIFSIILVACFWLCFKLAKNFIAARKFGLPILVTPIGIFNPLWLTGFRLFTPILKCLPFGLGNFVDASGNTWFFPNRFRHHARLGPAFVIATPTEVQLILADPDAVNEVLAKRKNFIKDFDTIRPFLDIFGPNVVTAGNDTWPRHRRLTTPPFKEAQSSFVWREALAQSVSMVKLWMSKRRDGVEDSPSDIMTLTLHVLISVGLGKTYDFDGGTRDLDENHTQSYREALQTILENLLVVFLTKTIPFPTIALPASLRKVKDSVRELKDYMSEMMAEQRLATHKPDAVAKDNLMSVLLKASESKGDDGRSILSDEEIFGNLFIYNFVGHDTTANTLLYCLYLLSVHPEIQEWIREEIAVVFHDIDVQDWEYEKAFPRLTRCLALMHETLRLYPPVVAHPRHTGNSHQTLAIRDNTYSIPPKTVILLNVVALNTLPEYWGSDSLSWRPKRWISQEKDSGSLADEQLFQPREGVYTPFASGPRVCPAKKFAQVEFVAVIAQLFRKHRCSPIQLQGESTSESRKRVLRVIEDSNVLNTLKMLHPERVRLRWEKVA
ncbi:cytochrome P450 [Xylariaceae sp. FL1651]|nr:cytochrome P450 [Xylariaceae sp. FL1651]